MFQQINVIAMGGPLGLTMAEIFLGMAEKQMYRQVVQFIMCKRYVDDILMFTDEKYFTK